MAQTDIPAVVAGRLKPLVEALHQAHGPRLKAVVAYGPWAMGTGDRGPVLVVLEDATAPRLTEAAPAVGQCCRGVEPLFVDPDEIGRSLDVFPLEYLAMEAAYAVIEGDDPLAELAFDPGAVRRQLEGELRSLLHCFRQEVGRRGHRPREIRRVVAQSMDQLARCWRGLLWLHGQETPADPEALAEAAAAAYGLDRQLLSKLRGVELGARMPGAEDLPAMLGEFDRLLVQLIDVVDRVEG